MNYDAIIIGSGVGGLAAAVELSNQKKKVLLLEQASDFGGYSNPFKRKKFHFDPGIHYIGDLSEGRLLRNTLEKLQLWDDMEFIRLPDDGYDRYAFPDFDFLMPASHELFRQRLEETFPEEKKGIDLYLRIMRALDFDPTLPGGQKKVLEELDAIDPWLKNIRKYTYGEVLQFIFGDGSEKIKAVLSGPCGDLGLPPGRCAAMALFGIFNHYIYGAFYPKGGSGAFRDAFTSRLEKNGVEMINRTRVARILYENGHTAGVVTDKGVEYRSKVVISNVDPILTYGELLGDSVINDRTKRKIENTEPSYASYCLFLGTDVPDENIKLGKENIWYYPGYDIDAIYNESDNMIPEGDFSFFLSCPSHKDPDSGKSPAGTNTLEAVLLTRFQGFEKWSGQKAMRREDDYKELKKKITEPILNQIERLYVKDLSKHIIIEELGTPVTNEFYALPYEGAIYGPAHTPEQMGMGRYMPRGSVRGLYLAGAGVFNCGIGPCTLSGQVAGQLAMRELG